MIKDKRVDDITEKKYGKLLVIERSEKRSGKNNQHILWKCICDCGNIHYTEAYKLKRGRKKSCGCMDSGRNPSFINNRGMALWNRLYLSTIKKRAKKQGYETDINIDLFIKISSENCFYCNSEGTQKLEDRIKNSEAFITFNGIDRINSSRGYFMDNIVSCCKHCNTAKNTLSQSDFKQLIKRIYENFAK